MLDLVARQFCHASIALTAKEKCNEKGRHEQAPTDKSVKAQVIGTHDRSNPVGRVPFLGEVSCVLLN
jgi:hypothetical protein